MYRTNRRFGPARVRTLVLLGVLVGTACAAAAAYGGHTSGWATAQKVDEIDGNHPDLNTSFQDGCPILSADGRSLYMASDRPGGQGGLDIWVAHRSNKNAPFGVPVNLPAPINSASADFCPTPVRGGLFFVSRRATSESCGLGDVYFAGYDRRRGWSEPVHLACEPNGPNSSLDEQGPSLLRAGGTAALYFSRSVPAGLGLPTVAGDIYVSRFGRGAFESATPVAELNDPAANDIQPNVRRDGREIVFSTSRAGGLGTQDIWASTRASIHDPWSPPVNLGPNVNTAAAETRPSFSRDARTLLFGRAPGPEGSSDIYVTTRQHGGGGHDDDDDEGDDD
jgi:WD40-like Beta Propeller Repeat